MSGLLALVVRTETRNESVDVMCIYRRPQPIHDRSHANLPRFNGELSPHRLPGPGRWRKADQQRRTSSQLDGPWGVREFDAPSAQVTQGHTIFATWSGEAGSRNFSVQNTRDSPSLVTQFGAGSCVVSVL